MHTQLRMHSHAHGFEGRPHVAYANYRLITSLWGSQLVLMFVLHAASKGKIVKGGI